MMDLLKDDLISRQAAKDAFIKATADGDKVDFCLWVLDNVPAIDPVKHEKWMVIGNTDLVTCKCGYMTSQYSISRYCPNCGARMDG